MYKIIVFDIDGTLVNSQKKITEKTKLYIKKALDKGVFVAIASGRPTSGVVDYALELNLHEHDGYILSYNGAVVTNFQTKEIVFKNKIEKKYLKEIYNYTKSRNLPLITYTDTHIITENDENKYMLIESTINKMPIKQVDDLLDVVDFDPVKCLIPFDPSVLKDEINPAIDALPFCSVYLSEPHFLEIMPLGVDKSFSMDALLTKLNLTKDEMIMCGDGFNDLTVIKYAGLGVAMQNAQQIVLDNADYITLSNDDEGIAHVIDKFILN